jgi:hypothetical protein
MRTPMTMHQVPAVSCRHRTAHGMTDIAAPQEPAHLRLLPMQQLIHGLQQAVSVEVDEEQGLQAVSVHQHQAVQQL